MFDSHNLVTQRILYLDCSRILHKRSCKPHRRLRSRPAPFGTASPSELLSMRLSRFYDIRNVKKETIGMYASGSYSRSSFPPLLHAEKEGAVSCSGRNSTRRRQPERCTEGKKELFLLHLAVSRSTEPFFHYDSPLPLSLSMFFLPSSST